MLTRGQLKFMTNHLLLYLKLEEVLLHQTALVADLGSRKNSLNRNDYNISFQTPLFKGEVAENKPYRDQTTQEGTHVQRR